LGLFQNLKELMVFTTKVRASNNLKVIKMVILVFLNYLNTMVISEMTSFSFRTMVPNSENSTGNLWVSVPAFDNRPTTLLMIFMGIP
jgi:hypothetical protein